MYFDDSQSQNLQNYDEEEEEEEDSDDNYASNSASPTTCSQGHRSTLVLQTKQGGSICLLCFSNLVSNPQSPTVHVSYALSQLSQALSDPPFLRSLLTFHPQLLVTALCDSSHPSLSSDFVARLSERLSSGDLAWSRRQVYTLHCLGVLLNSKQSNPYAHIRDKYGLITNLVSGLQLPSEETRGEILFVLYKVSSLQYASEDADGTDLSYSFCPKLVRLSLEALMNTQSDDVRLNCIALLTVLARRGLFGTVYALDLNSMSSSEGDSFGQATEDGKDVHPLNILFTEAIKGPLLSTDRQVQISTLDLLFHYMSCEGTSGREIQVLVEESIADYVFEILRLSECKDPVIQSCLQDSHNLELSSCQSAILLILYTSSLYDERLADDKLILASLEQLIMVNSTDLQSGATDSFTKMMLVHLYGLYRGLAKVSYKIPFSPEAERILFRVVTENEWDLPSARIHPISLKWFFQQEKMSKSLSHQLLRFCRRNTSNGSDIIGPMERIVMC
ncbi:hypothetical protein M0R45_020170 [Rubus argutus]|uniref:Uncharacterized protein n=1 Tax=Rubus argutus TaxID=59490 RepID=A0AAW1X9X2_RUBAR